MRGRRPQQLRHGNSELHESWHTCTCTHAARTHAARTYTARSHATCTHAAGTHAAGTYTTCAPGANAASATRPGAHATGTLSLDNADG